MRAKPSTSPPSPKQIRNEYGKHDAGQRMLMARRLVEGGVRFVSLTYGGWDMHANIARGMERQLPNFDQAYAALITDLDRRGMLDKTLVMVSAPSSAARRRSTRTPAAITGRASSPSPSPAAASSAATSMARPIRRAPSRITDPLTVENMAATVFNQLGIDGDKKLMSPGGRRSAIVKDGTVVTDLLA